MLSVTGTFAVVVPELPSITETLPALTAGTGIAPVVDETPSNRKP